MLSCKEVSKLASEALERQLPFRKRMGVTIHLMMCRACARFVKQMKFLKIAGKAIQEKVAMLDHLPKLSPESSQRIKESLKKK